MHQFRVVTSHSLARLAEQFAAGIASPPRAPFEREQVVVLSTGMSRWLSLELAALRGVAAGMEYRFPNELLDQCFRALMPDLPPSAVFSRESMTWRIAGCLPDLAGQPACSEVRRYLGDRLDDRRLLQLSCQLADLFDQYVIFRPEMVLAWDRGQDDGWQSRLWRAMSGEARGLHRAGLLQQLRSRAAAGLPMAGLPSRISLFGVSYLPPFHVEAFSLLAGLVPVTFYLQTPCGGYWGDLVSRRRLAGMAVREGEAVYDYCDSGNPLLSSLGRMGQEFHETLVALGCEGGLTEGDEPEECPPGLLRGIQSDIRMMRDRAREGTPLTLAAGDRSLEVHSCHGPMRELEVLYDSLLAMFDSMERLEPRQVVVMVPDMEGYAPYIDAVFGGRAGGRPALPYAVADRPLSCESPVLRAFGRILALPGSRFGVNQLRELLESPPVMARFELDEEELARLMEWLTSTGLRWGLDGEQRAALGFPAYDDFSWKASLDRLWLGYAMAPRGDSLFAGVLPFGDIEGRRAEALGKLADVLAALRAAAHQLEGRHTLGEWARILAALAEGLLAAADSDDGCQVLNEALQSLRQGEELCGFGGELGIEAVAGTLLSSFGEAGGGRGFLGGRITFCAMLPMRSIPFRVVCMVGMNDGVFPRTRRHPSFSLMAGARRPGDRSLRDEDRYIFLEALMAAGERLWISFTGQSDRDNSPLPPSVVVSELLDYAGGGFRSADTGLPPRLVTRHRLQGVSRDYFSGGELFSYAADYCTALHAVPGQHGVHPFLETPLPEPDGESVSLDLPALIRFLRNPAALFLARRLDVRPGRLEEEREEREPFILDGLGAFSLGQRMVDALMAGEPLPGVEVARAAGLLPPLLAGNAAYRRIAGECRDFTAAIPPCGDVIEHPFTAVLDHNGMRLTVNMAGLRAKRHLRWRFARLKGGDLLALWVEHLALNALAPAGYPRQSLLVCRDRDFSLAPLDQARRILCDLLDLYREGLCRPLHFFPESSYLLATRGIDAARTAWQGAEFSRARPECGNAAFALCFRDVDPLDNEFVLLAQRVYGPMLAATAEVTP